jgi:hypothetical protein
MGRGYYMRPSLKAKRRRERMLNKKKILGEVKKALAITLAGVMVTGFAQDLCGGGTYCKC